MSAAITGVAALTAVGDDAASTFAALRAGIAGLSEHPSYILSGQDPDEDPGEPLRAGRVPVIEPELAGHARLVELARGALRSLVADSSLTRDELRRSAFFLALPEPGPDVDPWDLARRFVPDFFEQIGLPAPAIIEIDQSGHTGALVALYGAGRCLAERRATSCVLLAVDSYLDEARIDDWDRRRRRLRSRRNRDGFLPGEAAVALLLEPPLDEARAALGSQRPARAHVSAPTFGLEPNPIEGELSPTGKGLTDAIRRSLAARSNAAAPRTVYADLNGESHRAFEWGLARTRLSPALDGVALLHPADCLGDVGAASGALLVGLAGHGMAREPRATTEPGGSAWVLTAATSGHRASTIVSDKPCLPA